MTKPWLVAFYDIWAGNVVDVLMAPIICLHPPLTLMQIWLLYLQLPPVLGKLLFKSNLLLLLVTFFQK